MPMESSIQPTLAYGDHDAKRHAVLATDFAKTVGGVTDAPNSLDQLVPQH